MSTQADRTSLGTMATLAELDPVTASMFAPLTFPAYRPLLQSGDRNVVAIGAAVDGRPVAMALARYESGSAAADLLSLYVGASSRRAGLGALVLAAIENALAVRGAREIQLIYTYGDPGSQSLERLLLRSGWDTPRVRMLLCKGTPTRMAGAPWMNGYRLPAHFEIFPWTSLTREEREYVRVENGALDYPDTLSPFDNEAVIEPMNSLGLRVRGEIAGWIITHRIAPDVVSYARLFVRADLERTGRGVCLLVESFRRHVAHAFARGQEDTLCGTFAVVITNAPMVRFVRTRLAPYLVSISMSKTSSKVLSGPVRSREASGVQTFDLARAAE